MLEENKDLYRETFKGETFEQCLGILGAELGLALDGTYDINELCGKLLERMRSRKVATPLLVKAHQ